MKSMVAKFKDIYIKLMYILTKQQKQIGVVLILLSFIAALLETLGVSAIYPLINAMMTPQKLMENEFVAELFEALNVKTNEGIILVVGLGVILLYILKNIFFIFLSWFRAKYACKVQRELSIHMMNAYMDKGYPFFLTKNTSELMRGVFNDTSGVYSFLSQLFKMAVDIMTVFLICVFIFITDWEMALGVMGLAVVCVLIIFLFFKQRMQILGKEARKYGTIVNQQAIQAFQGIKEVIVMRKQRYFLDNFEDACQKQRTVMVGQTVGSESPAYIIEAICITGLLGIVCLRVIMTPGSTETMLPALSAFAVGAFRILPSLGKISSGINTLNFYLPFLTKMYNQLVGTEDSTDSLKNIYQTEGYSSDEEFTFGKELKADRISWKYAPNREWVLKDLSFTVKKGEAVALIGSSGAGKTTLADILLGLLKPQEGKVSIDGRDIFTFGEEWSKVMGYVPQAVYLTDDSLRRNIAFGIKDEAISDERIWEVLEQAQLKEFVESLEEGLNTRIGERGVRFSGGQRQRIAIARALYADPEILILDEATAALDNETESAVMEAIEALKGKVTLLIIAHRLSTIRKCDKVYEVKEQGIFERRKEEVLEYDGEQGTSK